MRSPKSVVGVPCPRRNDYDRTVDISSDEAKRAQFSGTAYSYDAREVEAFRRRVVATLAVYETARPDAMRTAADNVPDDLGAAQRARHQAVELAERMLRDVMGTSGGDVEGLSVWQEAAMLRAAAAEELAFAEEEAKRLLAIAQAEGDEIRSGHAAELRGRRAELQRELQASRDAADAEVNGIRARANEEANDIVHRAAERADDARKAAAAEAHRLERRIAVLHTALADAEGRFRRLAATAANEVGTMQAIIDEDVAGFEPATPPARPELYLASVDLTDAGLHAAEADKPAPEEEETPAHSGMVAKNPEVGFYQRRLAGLRDRLEKSGHPPE